MFIERFSSRNAAEEVRYLFAQQAHARCITARNNAIAMSDDVVHWDARIC